MGRHYWAQRACVTFQGVLGGISIMEAFVWAWEICFDTQL